MGAYQTTISAIIGTAKYDPRHIEAWMRCEHGTLDRLSKIAFKTEVVVAMQCIDAAGKAQSEQLAQSFGL